MKLLTLISLLFPLAICSQELIKDKSINYSADYITSDPLNNIFIAKADHITKLDEKGDTLFKQSLKITGKITSIDASQALRILVYFEDQQSIGFLDNTLSWHNEVRDLTLAGITSSMAACHSFLGNSVWVFDQENFSLKKFDKNFRLESETGNLAAIFGNSFQVKKMKEVDNRLYIQIYEEGIFVFDNFGTYITLLPLEKADDFDIVDHFIYYSKEGKLYKYDMKNFEITQLNLEHHNISLFTVTSNVLVIQDKTKIFFYKIR